MLAPPQAHVHMAHLCLQKNDLEAAVASYDRAVGLLRMKQELIDCFSMREAAAAQLALLREQPDIFGPVMEDNRKRAQRHSHSRRRHLSLSAATFTLPLMMQEKAAFPSSLGEVSRVSHLVFGGEGLGTKNKKFKCEVSQWI